MQFKRNREFYVYRYIDLSTGHIFYIGKTNCSLKARVEAHKKEEAFQKFLDYKIEYTKLTNEVETDSVEKFLINYYKPVLNQKDKVEGLTDSLNLPQLIWEDYSVYLETIQKKKSIFREQAKIVAQLDMEFLYDCLGCLKERGEFTSEFLHPTGTLPIGNHIVSITEPIVHKKGELYIQKLKPFILKELIDKENRILLNIWMPVIQRSEIPVYVLENFSLYETFLEFAKIEKWFVYEGYCMGENSNSYELELPIQYKKILPFIKKECLYEWKNKDAFLIEWGREDHEALDILEEQIAKDLIHLLKSVDIITYGYAA